ncbi:MAG: sigma-70 family RNA polymerase sigma factor, partial [Candidatus Poribacteria bacterium]
DRRRLSNLRLIRHIGSSDLRDTRDRRDVDDFVQEVLARVYASPRRDFTDEELTAWVSTIARNTARSWNRKMRPHLVDVLQEVPLDAPSIDRTLEDRERWDALMHALSRLSDRDRELIRAYYLEERPYGEVLQRFGLTYGAFRARLSRARRALRTQLVSLLTLWGLLDATLRERGFGEARQGSSKLATTISTTASVLLVVGAVLTAFNAEVAAGDRASSNGLGGTDATPVQWVVAAPEASQNIATPQDQPSTAGNDMKIGWVSQLMVMQKGLKGVGVEHPDSWLMGGMGYAFVANATPGLGAGDMVTSVGWNPKRSFELAENLGFKTGRVHAPKDAPDFAAKQKEAWDGIRKALDAGYACYGFMMEIPEYSTIHGYDDVGYLYSGRFGESGDPAPWQQLGIDDDTGVLDVGWMSPTTAADDLTVVREALRFALDFADGTSRWSVDPAVGGLAAYDYWISTLGSAEPADHFKIAYNAEIWRECRTMAAGFLEEARVRVGTDDTRAAFEDAQSHYATVSGQLQEVALLFPFFGAQDSDENTQDDTRRERAIEHLRAVRAAEVAGLAALEKLVALL